MFLSSLRREAALETPLEFHVTAWRASLRDPALIVALAAEAGARGLGNNERRNPGPDFLRRARRFCRRERREQENQGSYQQGASHS